MAEAMPATDQTCSYDGGTWKCPFVAEEGPEQRCIFHLPDDRKRPEDFWRHMAWYLSELLQQAPDQRVRDYWRSGHVPAWFRNRGTAPQIALTRYTETAQRERAWRFAGFVFPEMDELHSFADMVLPFCDFHEATFTGCAGFSGTHFLAEAVFDSARFHGEADFAGADFQSLAYFTEARFSAKACFTVTHFVEAVFTVAVFDARVEFQSSTFKGDASFDHTVFAGVVLFTRAGFGARADFSGARLESDADFTGAHFGAILTFERAHLCGERTTFQDAEFSGQIWFRRAVLDTLLVMRYANLRNQMMFDGTRMENRTRVLLWGLNFAHGTSDVLMVEREVRSQKISQTITTSKQSKWEGSVVEPAGQVVFRDITGGMDRVSFLHTDILTDRLHVRFSNVRWEKDPHHFIFDAVLEFTHHGEWSREALALKTGLTPSTIAELPELYFADYPKNRTVPAREQKDKELLLCEPLVKQDVERIAREIRLSYEKYGHYGDAGDYYIAEMDFRRKRTPWLRQNFPELTSERRWWRRGWRRFTGFISSLGYRAALELYRLTSRYGESPGKALFSLSAALLLFSSVFVISGFRLEDRLVDRNLWPPVPALLKATASDFWLAIQLSLANLMPGNLRSHELGFSLTSQATKAWVVGQVIITYVLLTLFLLAIRRRFRR